jgi:glycogen synthase
MTDGLKRNIAAMKATKQLPHFVQVLVTLEEADAEIERQQTDYSILKRDYDAQRAELDEAKEIGNRLIIEAVAKGAEVERLQRLYKTAQDQCGMLYNEIERLTAQKAELLATCAVAAARIERVQTWLQEKAKPTP